MLLCAKYRISQRNVIVYCSILVSMLAVVLFFVVVDSPKRYDT